MSDRRWVLAFFLLLVLLPWLLFAQQPVPWHDPSPHTVQFVAVDDNVKLEVLDWGGSGRPLVLLTGLGNTAHVFDDFAPKLTPQYHVYGITRRGYGASSAPTPDATNYTADRLGDDVLAVLDALKLNRPFLAGHSIAGEELSSIGSRHPDRVAGLIYLDAVYSYAYYALPGPDRVAFDVRDLQKELESFQEDKPAAEQRQLVRKLLQDSLPGLEKDLHDIQQFQDAAPAQPQSGPAPTDGDLASFAAWRAWMLRVNEGFAVPEAELRQQRDVRPDGGVGESRNQPAVASAINAGEQKYTEIRGRILAIFANPRKPGPYPFNTPAERAAAVAMEASGIDAVAKAFQKGLPTARVVQIPQSNHYVFLSNEADVLREMNAFLSGLP